MAPRLGRRYRYLLQISDVATITASAVFGAVTLSHVSPVRAGNLGVRDVALAAVAMAVTLHLHGLIPPACVAAAAERVVATRGDRALPANGCPARTRSRRIHPPRRANDADIRGGDDTARHCVGSVWTSTDRPDVRPDRDPHSGGRNGTDL